MQGHQTELPEPTPQHSTTTPEPKSVEPAGVRPTSATGPARFTTAPETRRGLRTISVPLSDVAAPAPASSAGETLATVAFERDGPPLWSILPGPVDHPAFPGLLAGILLAVAAVVCRGDRSDPKLAEAVIDARDERTSFR